MFLPAAVSGSLAESLTPPAVASPLRATQQQPRSHEPSPGALAKAEAELAAFDRRTADLLADLAAAEADLARVRRELRARQRAERARPERRRLAEVGEQDKRLEAWRSS